MGKSLNLRIKATPFLLPTLTYQVFFDSQTDGAVAELEQDIRRTIRATFRTFASPPPESNVSFLSTWDDVEKVPIFGYPSSPLADLKKDPPCSFFYAHRGHAQGNHTIPQPVLAIYPTDVRR